MPSCRGFAQGQHCPPQLAKIPAIVDLCAVLKGLCAQNLPPLQNIIALALPYSKSLVVKTPRLRSLSISLSPSSSPLMYNQAASMQFLGPPSLVSTSKFLHNPYTRTRFTIHTELLGVFHTPRSPVPSRTLRSRKRCSSHISHRNRNLPQETPENCRTRFLDHQN